MQTFPKTFQLKSITGSCRAWDVCLSLSVSVILIRTMWMIDYYCNIHAINAPDTNVFCSSSINNTSFDTHPVPLSRVGLVSAVGATPDVDSHLKQILQPPFFCLSNNTVGTDQRQTVEYTWQKIINIRSNDTLWLQQFDSQNGEGVHAGAVT